MNSKSILSLYLRLFCLVILVVAISCSKDDNGNGNGDEPEYPETVTDIDGNVYETVLIGEQLWFAENLKTTRYANGDEIPSGLSNPQWEDTSQGALTLYPASYTWTVNTDDQMLNAYGLLYNFYAVADNRGLCPQGWRVPSDLDWQILLQYAVESHQGVTSENVGNALKSCRQLNSPLGDDCAVEYAPFWSFNDEQYGTDLFGFGALPAGLRDRHGEYSGVAYTSAFWSSTEGADLTSPGRYMFYTEADVAKGSFFQHVGLSVRCIWEGE